MQEVAFTLANGDRLRAGGAGGAGSTSTTFAPQLSFFFNAHNNLLEEVAKFRAARRLWARIMRERFGARDPRSQMLRFHAQTAGSTLTAQQPENNIVRVAVQALAAVLGGCQSLHTNSMDEALVAAHRGGRAHRAPHPAGPRPRVGRRRRPSTRSAAPTPSSASPATSRRRRDGLHRRRSTGSAARCAAIAFMQREIQDAAYRYQQEVESRARVVVGVNEFVSDEPPPGNLFQLDAAPVEAGSPSGSRAARGARDGAGRPRALDALERAARGPRQPAATALDAVQAEVTLGEICDRLRAVFGSTALGGILTPMRRVTGLGGGGRRGAVVLALAAVIAALLAGGRPARADILQDLGVSYQKVAEQLVAAFPKAEVQVTAVTPDGIRIEGAGVENLRPGSS